MMTWIFSCLAAESDKRTIAASRVVKRMGQDFVRLESREVLSTFLVQNLADSGEGSLRAAIEKANNQPGPDVIRFRAGLNGTIALTSGQLEIRDALRLQGPGENRLTISGNLQSRVFRVESPTGPVTLRGFTVADGLASEPENVGIRVVRGGGILNLHGQLRLVDLTFRNNRAVDLGKGGAVDVVGGGAVANSEHAVLEVHRCTFVANSASGGTRYAFGGAIASVTSSKAFIHESRFRNNLVTDGTVNYGGAVAAFGGSSASLSKSEFSGNKAVGNDQRQAFGGALAARPGTVENSPSELVAMKCRFSGNSAEAGTQSSAGGGAVFSQGSLFVVDGSEFSGNWVSAGVASGGGIQSEQSIGLVIASQLKSNQAIGLFSMESTGTARGGAISSTRGGMLTVAQSELRLNEARGFLAFGGGISQGGVSGEEVAMLFIDRSSIVRNRAVTTQAHSNSSAVGGGIFSGNPGELTSPNISVTATRTQIQRNSAIAEAAGKGYGGGVYSLGDFSVDRRLQRQLLDGWAENFATSGYSEIFGEMTLI